MPRPATSHYELAVSEARARELAMLYTITRPRRSVDVFDDDEVPDAMIAVEVRRMRRSILR